MDVGQKVKPVKLTQKTFHVKPVMKFELTPSQKRVSDNVLNHLRNGKDVFVYAATGAGKTEITYASICDYLARGKKVCFAISRRQVVLEIADRLQSVFPTLNVICVAQGYTDILDGDIIVCTMHQLYRYPQCFDLMIMDEIDAFPYVGNTLLQQLSKDACRGQKLCLSATPDEQSLEAMKNHMMEMECLFERPHKHPLVVPKVIQVSLFFQFWIAFFFCLSCKKEKKQVLFFVPRKQDGQWISLILSLFVKTKAIHSASKDKDEILDAFRAGKLDVLVCTTLLERGITVPSVQVVVYHGDHAVFTTASLIQIYGRIGRTFKDPTGRGLCLCQYANESVRLCCEQIKWMNDSVRSVKSPSTPQTI